MITSKKISLMVLALCAQAATVNATINASYTVTSPAANVLFVWNNANNWKLPAGGKGVIRFTVSSPSALSDVMVGLSPSASLDINKGIYLALNGWSNQKWIARKLNGTDLISPTTGGTLPGGTNNIIPNNTKIDVQITVDQPTITVSARVNGTTTDYAQIFTYTLPASHPAFSPTATTAWNNFSFSGWGNTLNFTEITTSALPVASAPPAITTTSTTPATEGSTEAITTTTTTTTPATATWTVAPPAFSTWDTLTPCYNFKFEFTTTDINNCVYLALSETANLGASSVYITVTNGKCSIYKGDGTYLSVLNNYEGLVTGNNIVAWVGLRDNLINLSFFNKSTLKSLDNALTYATNGKIYKYYSFAPSTTTTYSEIRFQN